MSTSGNTAKGERSASRSEARIDDYKGLAKPDFFYGDRHRLAD